MKHLFILILALQFACSAKKEPSNPGVDDTIQVDSETSIDLDNGKTLNELKPLAVDTLTIHDSLYSLYQYYDSIHDNRVGEFTSSLVRTISQFKNRAADTTVLLIGDIDGKHDRNDTISTRIVVSNSTVHVRSVWWKNKEVLWRYDYTNPYLQVTNDEIFDIDKRSIWVIFNIAINYGTPEFELQFGDGPDDPAQHLNGQQIVLFGQPYNRLAAVIWNDIDQEFQKW